MSEEPTFSTRAEAVFEAISDARHDAFWAGRPMTIHACDRGRGCTSNAENCARCETIIVHPLGNVEFIPARLN